MKLRSRNFAGYAVATFKKLDSGGWQAQDEGIQNKGYGSGLGKSTRIPHCRGDQSTSKMTLGRLFQRYAREVSPTKRGARWEYVRLDALCRDTIADIPLRQIAPADFADWRDRRLRQVRLPV